MNLRKRTREVEQSQFLKVILVITIIEIFCLLFTSVFSALTYVPMPDIAFANISIKFIFGLITQIAFMITLGFGLFNTIYSIEYSRIYGTTWRTIAAFLSFFMPIPFYQLYILTERIYKNEREYLFVK